MSAQLPRVAAARLAHETNVFSATPTTYAAFRDAPLLTGEEILREFRDTNTEFGGFIDGAAREGFALVPLFDAWVTPSGLVTADAITRLLTGLEIGLRAAMTNGPLAGVLMALHGAMVTELDRDGDGLILERVRAVVGPDTPVVATLDLHANVSRRMVTAANLLVGFDTYPHVDMAERGEEACALLGRLIRGEIRPVSALRKPPMMPTSQRMTTSRMPMRALLDKAHEFEERRDVLAVTVSGGFPPADVAEGGFSVLVVTDNDAPLAAKLADELALDAWKAREGFLGGVASWNEAAELIRARERGELAGSGPVVLVDISDNPWTGGPGDSAELVRFLFARRVANAVVVLVKDPDVVGAAIAAGPGAVLDVALGGKTDALHGASVPARARVRLLSDGQYVNDGPMMAGVTVNLGPTALLECSNPDDPAAPMVEVLVTSRAETPIDLMVLRAHGIDPLRRRVLALKGKGHFRAAFEPIASRVVLVEGPGITGSDLSRLTFQHVRRPIWPLDKEIEYPAPVTPGRPDARGTTPGSPTAG